MDKQIGCELLRGVWQGMDTVPKFRSAEVAQSEPFSANSLIGLIEVSMASIPAPSMLILQSAEQSSSAEGTLAGQLWAETLLGARIDRDTARTGPSCSDADTIIDGGLVIVGFFVFGP